MAEPAAVYSVTDSDEERREPTSLWPSLTAIYSSGSIGEGVGLIVVQFATINSGGKCGEVVGPVCPSPPPSSISVSPDGGAGATPTSCALAD